MKKKAIHPDLEAFIEDIDYLDVKCIEANTNLRAFIAGMLSYYPWWVVLLYRIREILVRFLGLVKHDAPAELPSFRSEDISFAPGENASFFLVRKSEENQYWLAETPKDKHLTAYFGVVAQRTSSGRNEFQVITAIRYLHWSGPVYFNLIRPFHHLVVRQMMKAGVRGPSSKMTSSQADTGCALIDRFSLMERIIMRVGWYGFMAIGTYAIYRQAPAWAVFYVAYALFAFAFIVLPGLCAHCPYPSKYGTCLFLPPAFMNRFYSYKGPKIHLVTKVAVTVAMVGMVVIPQVWLFADSFLLLLFWLFGLPTLAAFPIYYCKRCRNVDCPLNKAGSLKSAID